MWFFQHFFTWKYHIMIHSRFTFRWSPIKKGEYWKGFLFSTGHPNGSCWLESRTIHCKNVFCQLGSLSHRDQLGGQQQNARFPGFFSLYWRLKDFPCRQKKMWQPTCTRCFSSGVWIEWLMQCHEGTIFQREINVNYKLQWCRNCCFLMLPILWGYQQLAKRLGV